jgi:hypothetical protein
MRFALAGLVSLLSAGLTVLGSSDAQATGPWGTPIEAPGTAALNADGSSIMLDLSCGAIGNCGAIGFYKDGASDYQAFVENEVAGTWGSAEEIPGFAALNVGGDVGDIMLISCAGVGSCTAGGDYADASGTLQSFVVEESDGIWGNAEEVPGFSSANGAGPGTTLLSLSCSSPGNCGAGGSYVNASGQIQAYVISEAGGQWGSAFEVPGTASLNGGGYAGLDALQCAANGDCSASGYYTTAQNLVGTFVVSEAGGNWLNAGGLSFTGIGAATGDAAPSVLACGSPGNCSLSGVFTTSATEFNSYFVNQVGGVWQSPKDPSPNYDTNFQVAYSSMSCTSSGNCAASGVISEGPDSRQALVDLENNGVWGQGQLLNGLVYGGPDQIPGLGAGSNNVGNSVGVSVSCVGDLACTAVGEYYDSANQQQAFVVDESNGAWGTATELTGSQTLNLGGGDAIVSVSCMVDDSCSIVGGYTDAAQNVQSFVDTSAAVFTAPLAPTVMVASKSAGDISVGVSVPTNDGGSVITGYQYSLNGQGWVNVPLAQASNFQIRHLKPHKKYRVEIRAVNLIGDGTPASSLVIVK